MSTRDLGSAPTGPAGCEPRQTSVACDKLLASAYRELHRLGHSRLRLEHAASMETCDLVQETVLRLLPAGAAWESRRHFFGAAARAMREVLIDRARRRHATKRTRGTWRAPLVHEREPDCLVDQLAMNDALVRLRLVNALGAEVVDCLFFLGFTVEETAGLLGYAPRSIWNHWHGAREWLRNELEGVLCSPVNEYLQRRQSLGGLEVDTTPPEHPAEVGLYRIVKFVGSGSMGLVYLARLREGGGLGVALKLIRRFQQTARLVSRLRSEQGVLESLAHPNIVRVHRVDCDDAARPYLVMDYVVGGPLTTYCDSGRLPVRHRVRLFRQVCAGVQHAHDRALLHCDIKPSNILVSQKGRSVNVKLIDFGIAGRVDRSDPLREHGCFRGTLDYCSPEHLDRRLGPLGLQSDVYSLGLVLFELLTGVNPGAGRTWRAGNGASEHTIQPPSACLKSLGPQAVPLAAARSVEPSALSEHLERRLDGIVLTALQHRPDRRYPTVHDFASDIDHYLTLQH